MVTPAACLSVAAAKPTDATALPAAALVSDCCPTPPASVPRTGRDGYIAGATPMPSHTSPVYERRRVTQLLFADHVSVQPAQPATGSVWSPEAALLQMEEPLPLT